MLFNKDKKYLDAPVSDAANFLRQTKISMELPENIILCPVGALTKTVENNYKTKRAKLGLEGDVYFFEKHNCAFMTNFGMGAPNIAMTMEILIALGAKNFALTGFAGSLQKYLNVGDIVICSSALRDEGVSSSYAAPGDFSYPDENLTGKLKAAFEKQNLPCKYGPTWTTDVLFRETAAEITHYQKQKVLTVEMEAAAAFAVAARYKTSCAAVFAVSDQLANLKWEPAFGHASIDGAMQKILKTILAVFN